MFRGDVVRLFALGQETTLSQELEHGLIYRVMERTTKTPKVDAPAKAAASGADAGSGGTADAAEKKQPASPSSESVTEIVWRCMNRHVEQCAVEVVLTFHPENMDKPANHDLPASGFVVRKTVPPQTTAVRCARCSFGAVLVSLILLRLTPGLTRLRVR